MFQLRKVGHVKAACRSRNKKVTTTKQQEPRVEAEVSEPKDKTGKLIQHTMSEETERGTFLYYFEGAGANNTN